VTPGTSERQDSFRVGLTGGIASGKTTVANMFGELGAVLIDTDIIAREVVDKGSAGLARVVDKFGSSILDADGGLDRRAMRNIVFADDEKRLQLEEVLHPLIRTEAERQMRTKTGPYQLIIVPLLVESPLKDRLDRILVVDCSKERQLERLLARDLETPQQAHRMLAAQSSREDRLALADDVIVNDASLQLTRQQVADTHRRYLALASAESA
jgi:dephospho-CoA kinase